MHTGKRPALANRILFVVIQKAYSRRDENALAAESTVSITDGMTKTGRERQAARGSRGSAHQTEALWPVTCLARHTSSGSLNQPCDKSLPTQKPSLGDMPTSFI